MRKLITMREALSDPAYFADVLDGASWALWRVLLIASMGEALSPAELATFTQLTGRAMPPEEPVEAFWGIIGRRGGKTRAIGVLASYLAGCVDHRDVLGPGERGILPVMAASVLQASQAFHFIQGALEGSTHLSRLVDTITSDTISLISGVDIQVRPASFRTIRGISAVAAILDEVAFFRSDDSKNPDEEIIRALRPSLATTGGPLICISSPYAKRGALWKTFKRHYGAGGDPLNLVAKAASRIMNPSLSERVVQRAFDDDAAAASAEYGAEFRSDIESFVSPEVIESVVVSGRYELSPIPGTTYVAFVDPSGGSSDSMTLAIAHRAQNGTAVLDALRERKPPFSPEDVVQEFAGTIKAYGLSKVSGDRFGGEWPRERFRLSGISYELAEKSKSDFYREVLPMFNSGKVELLDNVRLISQFCGLERRTARGGRDSIDHPPGSHDDMANAVAGAMNLTHQRRGMMDIPPEILAWAAKPSPHIAARRRTSAYGW